MLETVGGLFQFSHVNTDAVICKQGDDADAFFIMLRGSARVRARR